MSHWTRHEGRPPHPLQLAGPALTSRALPEPGGAFRGLADGTSVGNLLCNKTTHKVKCRLKPLCLQGSGFYGVSWRSRDLSAHYPGGLGREGGAPRASWGQWVPRRCRVDGPQMGAMRTTHSGDTSRMGPRAGWDRRQGVQRGRRGSPQYPPLTPGQTQAAPSEVVQRGKRQHPLSRGLHEATGCGVRWPCERRSGPVAIS